jgi:hypothetical protein
MRKGEFTLICETTSVPLGLHHFVNKPPLLPLVGLVASGSPVEPIPHQRDRHLSDRIEHHPANETMSPIIIGPDHECRIEGVVTGVIRYCG